MEKIAFSTGRGAAPIAFDVTVHLMFVRVVGNSHTV